VAALLSNQPLPAGNKVAILTNAGGLGILCADACEAAGLVVPELSPATIEALEALLPAEASVANPVDMIASASAEQYAEVLKLLGEDQRVDAVVIIFIPPLVTRAEDVADALMGAAQGLDGKTLLACFLGVKGIHDRLSRGDLTIPSYSFPEDAARALGAASRYATWRRKPEGESWPERDVDRVATAKLSEELLRRPEGWLDAEDVAGVLDHYGIPNVRTEVAPTPEAVADVVGSMSLPVAVKIASRSIVHKSDIGGVRLGLPSPDEARAAAGDILKRLESEGLATQLDGFVVQEMGPSDATELFVGMTQDPLFGPLIAVGAGGTLVELLGDVSVRITPLTDVDVDEMLRSLRLYPLFKGYRGAPPLDEQALKDLLLKLSVMVEDLPQLSELDLNPVLVAPRGSGCMVVDARMRIARPSPPRPRGARLDARDR
jgi:acyl-CoA synthetase (NDP forming)